MKFKHIVLLNSLVLVVFGAAFMVRPFDMRALYGVIHSGWDVTGLLAVTLIGFGIVLYGVANAVQEERQQRVTVALLVANLLAFAISLAQQQAIWNTGMGWVTVAVYFLLAISYGYLALKGRSAHQTAHHA